MSETITKDDLKRAVIDALTESEVPMNKPLLDQSAAELFTGLKRKAFAAFAKAHGVKRHADGYYRRHELDRAIRDEPRKGNAWRPRA